MKKITFREYLDCFEKETVVGAFMENIEESPRLKPIIVKSEVERRKVNDTLEFYFRGCRLIEEYPKCRDMIIEGMERFERTGVKFQVCHNFCEYPDGEVPEDFMPLVLYFPGD